MRQVEDEGSGLCTPARMPRSTAGLHCAMLALLLQLALAAPYDFPDDSPTGPEPGEIEPTPDKPSTRDSSRTETRPSARQDSHVPWGFAVFSRSGIYSLLFRNPPSRRGTGRFSEIMADIWAFEETFVWRGSYSPVEGFSLGLDGGFGGIPGVLPINGIPFGLHAEAGAFVALGNDGSRDDAVPVGWVSGFSTRAEGLIFLTDRIGDEVIAPHYGLRPTLFSEFLVVVGFAVGLRVEYGLVMQNRVGDVGQMGGDRLGISFLLGGTF